MDWAVVSHCCTVPVNGALWHVMCGAVAADSVWSERCNALQLAAIVTSDRNTMSWQTRTSSSNSMCADHHSAVVILNNVTFCEKRPKIDWRLSVWNGLFFRVAVMCYFTVLIVWVLIVDVYVMWHSTLCDPCFSMPAVIIVQYQVCFH